MAEKNLVEQLQSTEPQPRRRHGPRVTREEGLAILDAIHRGLTHEQVAETIGSRRTNVTQIIGTWAIHHCRCKP